MDLTGLLSYGTFFLVFVAIYGVVVLGLNLQWGYTGLFNVGVAGFFALGAYTTALVTGPDYPEQVGGLGLPVVVGWLAALGVGALAGTAVGFAALRLREDYLAIATFGAAVVIQLVALNVQWLTGGTFGLQSIPRPLLEAIGSGWVWNAFYLAISVVTLVVTYRALERLVNSPWGRVLEAIREDEAAAESLGKRAFHYRLQSFAIGCALMALGGAMYAHFIGYIAAEDFVPILTFQIWAMLIVGGAGSNRAVLAGALLVWALWSASGGLVRAMLPVAEQARGAALQVVLIGVALAVMLVIRPQGRFRRPARGSVPG
jgi:branched-chain amino acid transport system permease protein